MEQGGSQIDAALNEVIRTTSGRNRRSSVSREQLSSFPLSSSLRLALVLGFWVFGFVTFAGSILFRTTFFLRLIFNCSTLSRLGSLECAGPGLASIQASGFQTAARPFSPRFSSSTSISRETSFLKVKKINYPPFILSASVCFPLFSDLSLVVFLALSARRKSTVFRKSPQFPPEIASDKRPEIASNRPASQGNEREEMQP